MEGGPRDRPAITASGSHLVPMIEQQLVDVRTQLAIRPEQERFWGAYRERVGALLADQLRPRPADETKGNALQQMERKVDTVRNRLAALEDIADAARGLYQQLDAAQREKADRLLPATLTALYPGPGMERPGEPSLPPESEGGRFGPPPR